MKAPAGFKPSWPRLLKEPPTLGTERLVDAIGSTTILPEDEDDDLTQDGEEKPNEL